VSRKNVVNSKYSFLIMSDSNPDTLLMQLSRRVEAFIEATGISQRKLAKLIKTDEAHFSNFLAGRTGLSATKTLRLMQVLNSSRTQLEKKLGRATKGTAQMPIFKRGAR
jgi:transcriptional regulator with XRE-family HTH domain